MSSQPLRAGILGASGYTGAETIRLLLNHPEVEVGAVSANALAGNALSDVFPHLRDAGPMMLERAEDIKWSELDVVFSCLPHGTSQDVLLSLPDHLKIIDLSADFRFRSAETYSEVYKRDHLDAAKTRDAVYGLTEFARDRLKGADIVACPGCYPTATLLATLPLVGAKVIDSEDILIDAKSGVSGAGRGLKEGNLFCEAAEGLHPYAVGAHRHAPEIEQEISGLAGSPVSISFTPHLVPMTRGELVTCYMRVANGADVQDLHKAIAESYANETFVSVLPFGSAAPDTRHVRGTNNCVISVHADRVKGRAIVVAVIDNLIKGSGGQAVQNLNAMMGWDETLGLSHLTPLFP